MRTLRLIATALILGACVFGGTIIFSASRIGSKVMGDNAIATAPFVVIFVVLLGTILVEWLVRKPPADADESTRLRAYGTRALAGAVVFEAAFLLAMLAYLFSLDSIILGVGLVLIAAMIVTRPSPERFQKWKDALRGS